MHWRDLDASIHCIRLITGLIWCVLSTNRPKVSLFEAYSHRLRTEIAESSLQMGIDWRSSTDTIEFKWLRFRGKSYNIFEMVKAYLCGFYVERPLGDHRSGGYSSEPYRWHPACQCPYQRAVCAHHEDADQLRWTIPPAGRMSTKRQGYETSFCTTRSLIISLRWASKECLIETTARWVIDEEPGPVAVAQESNLKQLSMKQVVILILVCLSVLCFQRCHTSFLVEAAHFHVTKPA